jgi:hypothetical protein
MVEQSALIGQCLYSNCVIIPENTPVSRLIDHKVHLTTTFSPRYQKIAEAGGVVVLAPNGTSCVLPTDRTSFKQAWWVGAPDDNNAGTIVYPAASTILGNEMAAPGGWADVRWWRMIQGGQTFLLNDFANMTSVNVTKTETLVRAIDIITLSRDKALLVQMNVGKGVVIGVGLLVLQECTHTDASVGAGVHLQGCSMPEKAWVLGSLLRYAGTLLPTMS